MINFTYFETPQEGLKCFIDDTMKESIKQKVLSSTIDGFIWGTVFGIVLIISLYLILRFKGLI